MALNKQELKTKINALPIFEKRSVFVADSSKKDEVEITKQFQQAICKVGESKAYCYVTPHYRLLQFKELFGPILNSVKEEVEGYLIHYGGFAALKFFPDIAQLKDGKDQFGLVAMNSVDKSTSIIVNFCVRHNDRDFTIPPSIAGLRKAHTGKAVNLTKNYIKFLGTVKETWKTIIKEFPKYRIVLENINTKNKDETEGETIDEEEETETRDLEFSSVSDNLKLGKRMHKKVMEHYENVTANGETFSLWDFFMKVFELIENINFKSEVHREKRVNKLCNKLFEYSMILEL